ncbi:hypothetical protein EV421DRAFT_2069709 [Armillaria borealis]|uniref:Uncharacterized protein n=1 Tax=Armillaria borealis TaxID=47425 RepID=A0AA39M5R1_9AGAR|nr:hypothetical protein EV421DRAFT_2069709 [Armillaria borealis]
MNGFPPEKQAGATFGTKPTWFQQIRDEQVLKGYEILGPFKDDDEWELAKWLIKHVGHNAADQFLRLNMIQNHAKPSFRNKKEYLDIIDQLPRGTDWKLEEITLTGDRLDIDGKPQTETLELWYRDPVDCIRELLGNPMFRDVMKYAPEKLSVDSQGSVPIVNEMWTGSWWWELQKYLPPGATIVPVILSSDKTRLSQFRGDKSAWPVYLTIGNISKDTRRDVSSHATILVGYLPVGKFDCYTEKARQVARYQTFHYAMELITRSLAEAGKAGVPMTCSDGQERWAWPILAAYVADYPEQCLIACCKENRCPICTVSPDNRGSHTENTFRTPEKTLEMIDKLRNGVSDPAFKEEWSNLGLRPVFNPFWRHLPFSNIFQCFTPDLLHQLHKGVFKDHLVKWCTELMSEQELDDRFRGMTGHPGLRHFKNGISTVSQWTGAEHKAMEQVFVGLIAGAVDNRVLMAVRAAVDFIYFASLHSHTSTTLSSLSRALDDFHQYKDVFIELEVRDHFNIPKIHAMDHYVHLIRQFGSADGFNTESPERLHIDYAKDAYRASNKRDYIAQMTTWLRRQEAVDRFTAYLHWCEHGAYLMMPTTSESDEDVVEGVISLHQSTSTWMLPLPSRSARSEARINIASAHPQDLCRVPASKIVEGHNAQRFLEAVSVFLRSHGSVMAPKEFDTFNLYRRLSVVLPAIAEAGAKARDLRNVVRAAPPVPARGRRLAEPAHLDFALVKTGERNDRTKGTALEGLRVAHVRVLFSLPQLFGVKTNKPLAYVEWFTPFGTPDSQTGLYSLNRSTRYHHVYAEIIEADRIVRNCHLQPKFGRRKDSRWTCENVPDLCSTFYFNTYRDLHLFCMDKLNKKDCV